MVKQKTYNNGFRYYWWLVVAVTGLITYTVIMLLARGQSIWFDEGYSIMLAKRSFADIFALTAVDAHPPFYYLLLKLWGEVFGFGEFALRSLSAVCTAGAVMTMLALLRRLFGVRVALLALPFLVIAPFLLRYGYEVRMYALATLVGVAATYALVCAYQAKNWRWWLVYAVLVALGMYTLYMTLAVWLAHAVWLLGMSLKQWRRGEQWWCWPWLYAFMGAVVLFAPYVGTFFHQLTNSALPGIGHELTLVGMVGILTNLFVYMPEWSVGGWLSLLLVAVTIIIGIVTYFALRRSEPTQRAWLLLLASLAVVPLLFFALSSLPPREPIFVVRYVAHVALFGYAFVACVLVLARASMRRPIFVGAYVTLLATLGIGVATLAHTGNFNIERMQYPETQAVRAALACNAETTIVADDPYTYIDTVYYFDGCNERFFSTEDVAMQGGYAPLHGSTQRLADASDVTTRRLVHLHWAGNEAAFIPPARYQLVNTAQYDKQVVDTYELSAE